MLRIFGVVGTGFVKAGGHPLDRNRENSREKVQFPS